MNLRSLVNKLSAIFFAGLFASTLALGATAAAASLKCPTGLLTGGIHDPLAVDSGSVWFTWMMNDNIRGSMQAAYQVIVASSKGNIERCDGDMWNSGKTSSSRSAGVVYRGRAVSPASRYWWKVRVWNNHGQVSPWSTAATFDIGLSKSDWKAYYIWDGTKNLNNFAYFRKTFLSSRKPDLAKVYVTAHNDYLLYFNGHLLGRGPARCDPYHYGQYNAYDITRLVKPGRNVFAAIAHWLGTWRDSGYNAKPAFLLEARLDYLDGSRATIGTDSSWKVLAHTPFVETGATYFGNGNRAAIKFDSRREPAGWRKVGFDVSKWASATVVDRSLYHLFAQLAPIEREQAALKPINITLTNGAWLVDFGRCIDGWPKLTMHTNRSGSVVRVQYFQMTGGRKPAGWDEYICHGGTETWDADFGRHTSFQVLKITGYAGRLRASDVRAMWAYCDADVVGRFHCSSPLVNAIYKMCVRSAQQNTQQGIISVDAQREQAPWLADSYLIGNVLLYNDRNTMMIDKVVRDYAAEQKANGSFQSCSPTTRTGTCAEWSMYWPMLLWQQYLFSGDQILLREMAPHLERSLDWLRSFQDPTTKLINPRAGRISDWAGGNMPSGGYNVATACQYYDNLRIASHVFSVLGQTNRSDEYRQQAEAVKEGINANLFNGRFYLARTDTNRMFPLASAWPLRFDIEPLDSKSQILIAIEKAGKPDIGGYGGDALYSGMLNAGDGTFVVRDLTRYRCMLEENKANWETWNTHDEVNHAWTSYPGYLLQKYILGVQPTGGGFATFDVRPDTRGLKYAEGAVASVKGLVTTRWEKGTNGKFSLSVHVPANTRASIYIPKLVKGKFTLTESGRVLWPAKSLVRDPGVLSIAKAGSSIKCLVGAGNYRFREGSSDSQ